MTSTQTFTDEQIERIIDEGMIYMCSCPAQVAESIRGLRSLQAFQKNCLTDSNNDPRVHQAITAAAQAAQNIMEACMVQVLALENWDRSTLTMPPGLRKRQMQDI